MEPPETVQTDRSELRSADAVGRPAGGNPHEPESWLVALAMSMAAVYAIRFAYELWMRSAFDPGDLDGLWDGFLFMKGMLYAWTGLIAFAAVLAVKRRIRKHTLPKVLVGAWFAWMGLGILCFRASAIAYSQAGNPTTAPSRLDELAHYRGLTVGYRLDQLLAANPNTSPATLQKLYKTGPPVWAELAANPHTPAEVLENLARKKEWAERVRTNPNLPDSGREELRRKGIPLKSAGEIQ